MSKNKKVKNLNEEPIKLDGLPTEENGIKDLPTGNEDGSTESELPLTDLVPGDVIVKPEQEEETPKDETPVDLPRIDVILSHFLAMEESPAGLIATQLLELEANLASGLDVKLEEAKGNIVNIFYVLNSLTPAAFEKGVVALADYLDIARKDVLHLNRVRTCYGQHDKYTYGLETLYRLSDKSRRHRVINTINSTLAAGVYKEELRSNFFNAFTPRG